MSVALVDSPNLGKWAKAVPAFKTKVHTLVYLGAGDEAALKVRLLVGWRCPWGPAGDGAAGHAASAPQPRMRCCTARPPRPTSLPPCNPSPRAPRQVCRDAGMAVHAFADFLAGGAGREVTPVPPKPDDVCCIMYTRWVLGGL